eukprot:218399_1
MTDYSPINLTAFPSVEGLQIEPYKAIESAPNWSFDSPNFAHIHTLMLHANNTHGWVRQFLNLKLINCESVTTLDCLDFGSSPSSNHVVDMRTNEFLSLLTKFPNLQIIKVVGLHIDGGMDTYQHLIPLFAKRLKYLSYAQAGDTLIDFSTLTFDALEEFQLVSSSVQSLDGILKSALNVNKVLMIQIQNQVTDATHGIMSNTDVKNSMAKLIVNLQRLKYMCLAVQSSAFCSAMEGIEDGLLKTERQHRRQFKIDIQVYMCGLNIKPNAIRSNVGRIVNALQLASIDEFMFIVEFHNTNDNELAKMFEDVKNFIDLDTIGYVHLYPHSCRFIITNRNCKIN